jgi:peptidoglycan-associated lipoprotein
MIRRLNRRLPLALTIALALLLAACGARPTQTLTEAEAALADAKIAEKCAPEEYQAALKALKKANELADKGENEEAKKQAIAAKKLAINARNKALLRKDECERENAPPPVAAVNPDEFIDKSGPGSMGEGSSDGLKTVYFDYNSSDLTPEARQTLSANAAWLKSKAVKVTIEGHCDKRGSTEYNLALGERRAMIVRNYLKSLGVNPDRMAVISYGEEKPLDYGEAEQGMARNRRAEFVVRGPAE